MNRRRKFLRTVFGLVAFGGTLMNPLFSLLASALEKTKKIILPKGTGRETLIDKNPALLDTGNLEITPLEGFGTMGLSDHQVITETWRLEVDGLVETPLKLTYGELTALSSIEKDVLLICPGFFANHGRWKGVSISLLLQRARAKGDVTHVTVRGPEGKFESLQRFPVGEITGDRIFLAYQVNGEPLPLRHGFPLRTVAEGYYGYDWVKYVFRITAEKI